MKVKIFSSEVNGFEDLVNTFMRNLPEAIHNIQYVKQSYHDRVLIITIFYLYE